MAHLDVCGDTAGANTTTRVYDRFGKRVFDLMIALVLMPVAAPLIAVLWGMVRLDGGPGFFGHVRVGKQGRRFRCWKLRSMAPDADLLLQRLLADDPDAAAEWAATFKLQNDPRVTRLGRILRQTGLDELPQFWNVLRGDMSLVGPRPITEDELDFYAGDPSVYLAHPPGLTGLWQVEGRTNGCFRRRVALDRRYVETRGLWTDLGILVRTARGVSQRTGC